MSLASSSTGSSITTSSGQSRTSSGHSSRPSQQLLDYGEDKEYLEFPRFTEDEIKHALKLEAQKHSLWDASAVKRMKILNIDTSVAFRYTLESFVEIRTTFESSERYGGQNCDFGNAPSVWDVVCHPRQMFSEEIQERELPGSAFVQKCTACSGQNGSHCYPCKGAGTSRCNICNGTGMKTGVPHPLIGPGSAFASQAQSKNGRNKSAALGTPMSFTPSTIAVSGAGLTSMDLCFQCQGRGVKECTHCKGKGNQTCDVCGGVGQLRKYTTLKIRFEVDKSEYLHEVGLPDDVMRRVHGEVIMSETRPHIYPLKNFPIEKINDQSRRLVQTHLSKHSGSAKILQQRHILEAIPVASITYELSGQKGVCWVIGLERMAYIPNYPKKCCIL